MGVKNKADRGRCFRLVWLAKLPCGRTELRKPIWPGTRAFGNVTFFFAFVVVLGPDRRCRLAGPPIRQQLTRRQPTRPHAPARGDRRRRRRWPPPPRAGPARQCRTPADDRRPERHRRRSQHRPRHAGRDAARRSAPPAPPKRRRGSHRSPRPPGKASRSGPTMFDHAEPPMPEPPPRPARPSFADEARRRAPMPPPPACRWNGASEPLAGFAPEPIGGRAEPAAPKRSRRDLPRRRTDAAQRTDDAAPARPAEPPKPPPMRAPRTALPRRRRRLLRHRRPPPTPTRISPRWRSVWKPRCAAPPRQRPKSPRLCSPNAPPARAARAERRPPRPRAAEDQL